MAGVGSVTVPVPMGTLQVNKHMPYEGDHVKCVFGDDLATDESARIYLVGTLVLAPVW